MEAFRQALGAVYFALAGAAGGDKALARASNILSGTIDTGSVTDPYALNVLRALVEDSQPLDHDPHGRIISLSVPDDIYRALDAAGGETQLSPSQVVLRVLASLTPEAQPCR